MINKFLDFLYPPVCPFCEKISKNGICDRCQKKISYIEEPRCMKCGKPIQSVEQEYCYDCSHFEYAFEQGRSLWVHIQPVSGAIYQYKFHNKRYYASVFAQEAAKVYGSWIIEKKIDAFIPVPLHTSRRRKRGFNQSELFAKFILEELKNQKNCGVDLKCVSKIQILNNILYRVKRTRPQKLLDDKERQTNLEGAFAVSSKWAAVENVLVIDDIYTTGTTINLISQLLKRAGVQKVYFLTISIGQGL